MLLNGERLVYAEAPEGSGPLYTRYYCSLPNIKGSSPPAHLYLDDDDLDREAKLVTFLQREDQPGRGIYYCIGLLKHGARERNAQAVAALPCLVVDLDLKNIADSRDQVIAA